MNVTVPLAGTVTGSVSHVNVNFRDTPSTLPFVALSAIILISTLSYVTSVSVRFCSVNSKSKVSFISFKLSFVFPLSPMIITGVFIAFLTFTSPAPCALGDVGTPSD